VISSNCLIDRFNSEVFFCRKSTRCVTNLGEKLKTLIDTVKRVEHTSENHDDNSQNQTTQSIDTARTKIIEEIPTRVARMYVEED